jgi:hypothetical protein
MRTCSPRQIKISFFKTKLSLRMKEIQKERNPDGVRRGALEVEPWFMEAGE